MTITGPQTHVVVRALGALRTASPPLNPPSVKWVWVAFILAVVILLATRNVHTPSGHSPIAMAAAGWPEAWGAYRQHLIHKGLAASSIGQYRFRLNCWRYWLWHPPRGRHRKDWWQAGPTDLTAFLARKCQPKGVHAGQPMSQATRAMYSHNIPLFYRHCYAAGLIDADPFAGYIPVLPPRPAPRPLDLGEVQRFLEHCERHPDPRLHLAASLCFWDALRSGEPTELKVEDLELGGDIPRMNLLGKGRVVRDWFPIHEEVLPALGPYLRWLASRHGVGHWQDLPAGTPLFQSLVKVGVPIDRSYLTRLLARAMRDAGVRGRPHDLRRTGANLVSEEFDDNPGPLRFVLRHRGYSSLESYRVPSLRRGQEYLAAIKLPAPTAPAAPT